MTFFRKAFGHEHMDEDNEAQLQDLPSHLRSELASNGCNKLENGKGEFGRCLSNPIPVNGPTGELKYLSMLRPGLAFHRLGSIESIDFGRVLDVYEIVTRDGSKWDVFYFDMFHARRSRIAPSGFSLDDYHKIFSRPLFAMGTNGFDKTFPHGIPEIMKKRFDGFLEHTQEKVYRIALKDLSTKDFRRPKEHFDRIQNVMKQIQSQFQLNESNKNEDLDETKIRVLYAYNRALAWTEALFDETFGTLKSSRLDVSETQRHLLQKEVARLTVFQLTRAIWVKFAEKEIESKNINALLFDWFKNKFEITWDEVEIYARAAGTAKEVQIFGKNVARIFDCYDSISIFKLNIQAVEKLEDLLKIVHEAFNLPVEKIKDLLTSNDHC